MLGAPSKQRLVLVTGGNKGVGFAICKRLLLEHPSIDVVLGARDRGRGEEAVGKLVSQHGVQQQRVQLLQLDVSSDESVMHAAAQLRQRYQAVVSPLFGIINNAGILEGDRMHEAGYMQRIMDTNVLGLRRMATAFLPLVEPDGGRVVNLGSGMAPAFVATCTPACQELLTDPSISWERILTFIQDVVAASEGPDAEACLSALGLNTNYKMFAYNISKALVAAATQALAREHPGLYINACCPGYIETDLTLFQRVQAGRTGKEMQMKSVDEGASSSVHLMTSDGVTSSGWFYGSDSQRSPLDRLRLPGAPAYEALRV